jgi:hypothetical protein
MNSKLAIITTEPNELCAELHNRMPVCSNPSPGRSGLGKSLPSGRTEGPARAVSIGRNDVLAGEARELET